MPVAPQVRCEARDDHVVPDARLDALLTAGAEVVLGGLKRVDQADVDILDVVSVAGAFSGPKCPIHVDKLAWHA